MSIGAVANRPATPANDQPAPSKSAPPTAVAIPAELQDLFTFTIDLNSPYLDYLLGQSLLNRPENERQAIAVTLIARTGLQGVDLVLPPGKLYLAPAKDTAMDKLLFRNEQTPWDLQELIVLCYSALKKAASGPPNVAAAEAPIPFTFGQFSGRAALSRSSVPVIPVPADNEAKTVELLVGQGTETIRFVIPAGGDIAEAQALYLILSKKQKEFGLPPITKINLTDPGLNPIVRFDPAGGRPIDVVFDNCSSEELSNWTEAGWQKAAQAVKMVFALNTYADHGLWRLVLLDSYEVQDKQIAPLLAHRMVNYQGVPAALIDGSDSYFDALQTMQISLRRDGQLLDHVVAHEMGHLLYSQWVRNDHALTQQFRRLFVLALGENRFELADDSNYLPVNDLVGHPFDEPGELFASFNAAYRTKPEQLAAFINDHSTPQLTKRLGIALWCLLRDRVYRGKVFVRDDPFGAADLAQVLASFTDEEVRLSLRQAQHSSNLLVAAAARNERFWPASVLPADR